MALLAAALNRAGWVAAVARITHRISACDRDAILSNRQVACRRWMRASYDHGSAGERMKARNDAVVAGVELATVLARLLPGIPRRGVPKARISSPGPGLLRFGVGAAYEDVTAQGVWLDMAETSAPFLRRAMGRKPPAVVRLVFHDGTLAVNSMTITATSIADLAEGSLASPTLPLPPPPPKRGVHLPAVQPGMQQAVQPPPRPAPSGLERGKEGELPSGASDKLPPTVRPASDPTRGDGHERPVDRTSLTPSADAPQHQPERPVPAPPTQGNGQWTARPPSSSSGSGLMWWGGSATVVFALVAFGFHNNREAARERLQSEQQRAVSELPPGVEGAWLTHVQAAVGRTITRSGPNYVAQVRDMYGHRGSVVSHIRRAYTVKCDDIMLSISVVFDGAEVPLLELTGASADGTDAPPLVVRYDSVAARQLREKLCIRVANILEEMARE